MRRLTPTLLLKPAPGRDQHPAPGLRSFLPAAQPHQARTTRPPPPPLKFPNRRERPISRTNQRPGDAASSTKRSPIPAGGPNLEYGASAVFPCGQNPLTIQTANLPHKSTSPEILRHQPHAPQPGRRPQLGVRRSRRLPMRPAPTPVPNGPAPAQIDVPRRHPASSTKRSPARQTDRGESAADEDGVPPPQINSHRHTACRAASNSPGRNPGSASKQRRGPVGG